ncbi:MAG: DNA-deoxyinosine glycosylase [Bacteroidetes bacterium]|nr:DNA-deoxyinosine glycosylase [Bacteroidota bacterium]
MHPLHQKQLQKLIEILGKERKQKSSNLKQSLPPISDSKSKILILGTMPGEESISKQEYYTHPRNFFWKIIAEITGNELPINYSQKKELLLKENIAIWDVCEICQRKGSLDSEIIDETPNDLGRFLKDRPLIKP